MSKPSARPSRLLVAAIVMAALNLRTAVTSVGPLLDELERGLGLSSSLAGLLTSLPVVVFAGLGWFTPRLAGRFGTRRLLAVALMVMSAGLALRALAGSPLLFLALSVPALAGGAVGNVLLPVIVKRDFPERVGPMTASYTTALAIGTTMAAAGTAPLSALAGAHQWRLGLGAWAAVAALAASAWLVLPGGAPGASHSRNTDAVPLRGSRTAWVLALFFGAQSMQAYIGFGWFAQFYRDQASVTAAQAGLLVAVMAAIAIPVSIVVPTLATRMRSQRPLVSGCVACYTLAYSGMLLAPRPGAWLWAVLTGLGGGAFPLALTFIGLRCRSPQTTAALSAFAQSIGYALAGSGPLLVGILHGATGGWTAPFALMFADLAVLAGTGWYISTPRYVDDDLLAQPTPDRGPRLGAGRRCPAESS